MAPPALHHMLPMPEGTGTAITRAFPRFFKQFHAVAPGATTGARAHLGEGAFGNRCLRPELHRILSKRGNA